MAKEALPHVDSFVADRSGVSELINMAWAVHELSDEYLVEVSKYIVCRNYVVLILFVCRLSIGLKRINQTEGVL